MHAGQLILKEIAHRQGGFWLSALGVSATLTLFVALFTTAGAAQRETTRVTRDLGFNLRIIPKATDMDRFWAAGFSDLTMPEDTVQRLASSHRVFLTYNHLVASLQRRLPVQGKDVLLTGLAPTVTAPAQRQQPMGFAIEPGTAHLGYTVASRLGLKPGETLELAGHRLEVVRCLVESGTDDDSRVFVTLADAQRILALPGQINEIKAIDCLCLTADQDPLRILRAELDRVLPEAQVIQLRAAADARAKQRRMVDQTTALLTPFLLLVCAAWVGVLAFLNVRERRAEIGVLRALGHGTPRIALLFLGKAVVIGLIGALAGYALGSAGALWAGPELFQVTARSLRAEPRLLIGALLAAPLFTALCSFVPAMLAVAQDPADILRES